jgi:4-amino-4-deoxy-L-arabinose transferase
MNSIFDPWFIVGIVLIATSVPAYFKNNTTGIALLIFGSFILRFWMAQLDPFLNLWDEQYHALVAKNLSDNLLLPTLLPDIEPYSSGHIWTYGHIWLHKQPFFLWLMALSIKLFGATEFAIRLPSVLFGSFSIFALYRFGKNVISDKVGFIAAFLLSLSYVHLKLISGQETTDHNDLIFASLILISFWLLSEYILHPSLKIAIWIGAIVGCAVLTKWLTGILVFGPWFLYLIFKLKSWNYWKHFILGAVTVLLLVIPWQVYAYMNFAVEYTHEMEFNKRHVYEVIEGHGGNSLFHFEKLSYLYFSINHWILLSLLVISSILLWRKQTSKISIYLIVLPSIIIYLFFTLVATKMPLFTYMINGLILTLLAYIIFEILNKILKYIPVHPALFFPIPLFILGFSLFRYSEVQLNHDIDMEPGWTYHFIRSTEREGITELKNHFSRSQKRQIIFNTRPGSHPSFTFYSDIPAYDFIPDSTTIRQHIRDGYSVIVLRTASLPENIKSIEEVSFYDFPYWE